MKHSNKPALTDTMTELCSMLSLACAILPESQNMNIVGMLSLELSGCFVEILDQILIKSKVLHRAAIAFAAKEFHSG